MTNSWPLLRRYFAHEPLRFPGLVAAVLSLRYDTLQSLLPRARELFEEKQPSDRNIEHAENHENHREKRIFGYL
jgi:hypothetical protein